MPIPDQSRYPRERIPPGQFVTEKFPVLHAGTVPSYDLREWNLRVTGAVENELTLSHDAFRKLPTRRVACDIHCVTTWSKLDTEWEGVPAAEIVRLANPHENARFVVAECEEGWTTNVLLDDLLREDALLAYRYGGKDLEPNHGFPLRLLLPHRYFWKSAKWLRGLRFATEDEPGFWEVRGYNNNADPWDEERYGDGSEGLRPLPPRR